MSHQHASLAAGRWQTLPLVEQLANVGSDVARAHRWQEKDPLLCEKAFIRALELLDMTIGDSRWKGRRKELTRVREFLWSDLASLDRYFYPFAVAARAGR
jgi:hypothetical protein